MKRKIFVSGATGFQGSSIANLLLKNDFEVISLSSKKGGLESSLTLHEGTLEDEKVLQEALNGVEVAIYTFPLIFDLGKAKQYTHNFIKAAEYQQIPFVIFNTSFDLPSTETGLLALDLKIAIKELLDASSLKVLTLVPDIYIDNLAAPWSIPLVLEQGILPYPVQSNTKVPWISHLDLAKFVFATIDRVGLAGQILPIGGQLLTGEEIAQALSNHLNKTVSFVSVKPDDFEKQLNPTFGDLAAREISNLYRYVEENQSNLVVKDFQKTQALLNVKPQSLEDWINSVKWQ